MVTFIRNDTTHPDAASLRLVRELSTQIVPDEPALKAWSEEYIQAHARRIAFDIDLVRRYARNADRVLEVGSTPPLLTASLKKLGYQIEGIDIAPERFGASLVHLNLRVSKCNIENDSLPFPDGSFDLVLFNEIFEHLRIDPIFTMGQVFRVIRPAGILLLSTPNLRSLHGILNFVFRGRSYSCCGGIFEEYEKLTRIGHMGHVREYTAREVGDFLSRVGFRIGNYIFRGGYDETLKRVCTNLFPRLRPFMTVVAIHPASER